MKITIIGPAYPYRGGIALFSNRLAESLSQVGHEVNIVTFKMQYPSFLFPGKTQFVTDKNGSELNIKRLINSVNPLNWVSVGKEISASKPDLVIFKYWMPFMAPCFGTIAKQIKKNNHTKNLALVHNLIPHEKRMGDAKLTNMFVDKMDGFISMSKSVLADIEKFDTKKPKVFSPHPLYDNFGEIKSRQEALKGLNLDAQYNYILFFGIVRKYKGLDILLNSLANNKLNNGWLKLIVAGEFYDNDSEYLEIIKKHKLEDIVILRNSFIPDAEVSNYFCAADIIVQPYRNATQSGVTQIAYHFNKPMLVTDVGGLKEIVPYNVGYVVQPNKDDVANALIDFYENGKAEEFTEGAKEEKKKYSWQTLVDTINKLYSNV